MIIGLLFLKGSNMEQLATNVTIPRVQIKIFVAAETKSCQITMQSLKLLHSVSQNYSKGGKLVEQFLVMSRDDRTRQSHQK